MAKITPMWLTTGIRGRADRTSNTYTKIDRHTGRVYAVTLRNPRKGKDFNDAQITQSNKFGAMSMGVGAWLRAAKSADASAVTIKDGQYSKTVQFEYNARPLVGAPEEEFTESGNHGTTDGGNGGNTDGGSVDPNPVNPETPADGEAFTIQAGVSADGGGSVSITKNGVAVSGNSVEASGSDTVVLTATENDGFQFLGWSDGNHQNPRTIQPSADMDVKASFLDLGEI